MRTYTAMISWTEPGKGHRCQYRNKTVRNILAGDIIKAGEIALTKAPEGSCPEINCLWYD